MDRYEAPPGPCRVDLRLFPMRDRLEPYRISREIAWLLVRNEGCTDIRFGFSEDSVLCTAGTTTPIPAERLPGGRC